MKSQNEQLDDVERAVHCRNYARAILLLIRIIRNLISEP